jgi:hypothetical protein
VKALDSFLWHQIQILVLMTGAFSVSLTLLKVGRLGCVATDAAPSLSDSLGGSRLGFFESCFLWSEGLPGAGGISEVVSPEGWFVTRRWSLLPTRQVANEVCGCLLPDCPRWSDTLLLLSASSWVAPQPRFWQVRSSPNQVGEFSVVHHPQSYETSSVIHHAPTLESWLVTPLYLS